MFREMSFAEMRELLPGKFVKVMITNGEIYGPAIVESVDAYSKNQRKFGLIAFITMGDLKIAVQTKYKEKPGTKIEILNNE